MRCPALALTLILAVAVGVSATTYTVRPDGTGDFPAIQDAIDAAVDGDVIELTDGTFTGDGNRDIDFLGKAVTVRSQSGVAENCIIDSQGSSGDPHRGFYFRNQEGPSSVLQGVTIRGGYVETDIWPYVDGGGGAIRCEDFSSPTIRGNIIRDNGARWYGAGILCDNASPRIEGNTVFHNITSAPHHWGGGISCRRFSSPVIVGNVITENYAGYGGGIWTSQSSPTIEGNFIARNEAYYGGGIGCYYEPSPVILCNTIVKNWAWGHFGGGVYCQGSSARIEGNTIASNDATWAESGHGGGIAACQSSPVTVLNTIVWGNTSPTGDDEIYVDETSTITVSCSDVGGGWPGTDNISDDPLFCDPATDDFTLCGDSPCLPENSPCSRLIGAGEGCAGPSGSIEGTVITGVTPMGGVAVELLDGGGRLVYSVATDAVDGSYEFAAQAGDYTVELNVPLGYKPGAGCPPIVSVTLEASGTVVVDFCLEETGIQECGLPPTGQRVCYDLDSPELCPSAGFPGQDPESAYGFLSFAVDSSVVGEPTIIDQNTGLEWTKEVFGPLSWQGALQWCAADLNALAYGGHTDWRLPNVKELASIADYGRDTPAIHYVFELVCPALACGFWSSTTIDDAPGEAWVVAFGSANDIGGPSTAKSNQHFVRAVRGVPLGLPDTGQTACYDAASEQPCSVPGFPGQDAEYAGPPLGYTIDSDVPSEETIHDNVTGLEWTRQAWNAPPGMDWQTALTWCAVDLNATGYGGHSDWRLPNVREIHSIVDYGRSYSALDPIFGPPVGSNYWSSSTCHAIYAGAWVLTPGKGVIQAIGKHQTPNNVRCVRCPGEVEPGLILGTVTGDAAPLGGVTVDLADGQGYLVDSRITDLVDGSYGFEAEPGEYTVEIVVPLGYAPGEGCPVARPVTLPAGGSEVVDFCLDETTITAAARSKGYWKHQYRVHDSGRGHAHESLDDLYSYQSAIFTHFFGRGDDYAIQLEGVTYSAGPEALTFEDANALLCTSGSIPMTTRAEREFLALLMNVVSGKVGTYHEASYDGATVSQVITFIGDLLEDGDDSNDELARDTAELVNENQSIAAGVVPLDAPQIAYGIAEPSERSTLSYAWPNPSRGPVVVSYSVPFPGDAVLLEVYNLAGRRVRTLVQDHQSGGSHRVLWRRDDDRGLQVAAGVYFYRLRVGDVTSRRSVVVLR
jgi:hypothetical protein